MLVNCPECRSPVFVRSAAIEQGKPQRCYSCKAQLLVSAGGQIEVATPGNKAEPAAPAAPAAPPPAPAPAPTPARWDEQATRVAAPDPRLVAASSAPRPVTIAGVTIDSLREQAKQHYLRKGQEVPASLDDMFADMPDAKTAVEVPVPRPPAPAEEPTAIAPDPTAPMGSAQNQGGALPWEPVPGEPPPPPLPPESQPWFAQGTAVNQIPEELLRLSIPTDEHRVSHEEMRRKIADAPVEELFGARGGMLGEPSIDDATLVGDDEIAALDDDLEPLTGTPIEEESAGSSPTETDDDQATVISPPPTGALDSSEVPVVSGALLDVDHAVREPSYEYAIKAPKPRQGGARRFAAALVVGAVIGGAAAYLLPSSSELPGAASSLAKATALLEEGKAEEAIPLLEQVLADSARDPQATRLLAIAHARAGNREQAEAAYLAWLALTDDPVEQDAVKKLLSLE